MEKNTTLTSFLNEEVEKLKEGETEIEDRVQGLEGDVESIDSSISRLGSSLQVVEETVNKGIECITSDVKSIGILVNHLTQATEENREGIDQLRQSVFPQQTDEDLLRNLAKHNFKGKLRRKLKFFFPGTREWLLKRLDDWFISNENEYTMLLLTAGPGFGKSVFVAKVCDKFKKQNKLAACHLCDFSDSNLRNPMMMLQSLASQMCENVPGFKEKLLDQLKRPHLVQTLKDAFGIYLQNPLDELELQQSILIVIDGLDESAAEDKNDIVSLIACYFPDLPECIKVLVTSRPEIPAEKLRGFQCINIENNDPKNNSDLQLYLENCLPSLDAEDIMFKILVKKCEGSFLYAFHVQSELLRRDDFGKLRFGEIIKFLPKGLDSIYQAYFNRLEGELESIIHEKVDLSRILQLLAASKGPLPLTFVSRILGFTPGCHETKRVINKVNEVVSCLLYVSDDLVTVFHKSVIDWLLTNGYDDHDYAVKLTDANKSLWLLCEQVFVAIKNNVSSGRSLDVTNEVNYALRNGFQHLIQSDMNESFFWVVDFVIIQTILMINYDTGSSRLNVIWNDIISGNVVISNELRARISWHVIEIGFLERQKESVMITCEKSLHICYLESVLIHSPKSYFSDDEKQMAELMLSNIPRFVKLNVYEVDVMPLAVRRRPMIIAATVSLSSKMVVVALGSGIISVLCLPELVELWYYSTEYQNISCCVFAPGDSLVLFGKLGTVLSIVEKKAVPFFHGNDETFKSCAFSPNGKRLVTSDGSSALKLWDIATEGLLTSFNAEAPVNWCSFSSAGLFIIGKWKQLRRCRRFCVWNALTWQRSDKRYLPKVEFKQQEFLQCKKCRRCFQEGLLELCVLSKHATIAKKKKLMLKKNAALRFGRELNSLLCSEGTYNGVKCIFLLDQYSQSFKIVESIHFTTLVAWNFMIKFDTSSPKTKQITAIGDDLWLYDDEKLLVVFKTHSPEQQQSSSLRSTYVLWSSFSPDGSRLATCTSDGYINSWNVDANRVDQRFESNPGVPTFACWWSKEFLLVFDFVNRIPRLLKYPVDVNYKILFSEGEQMSLCSDVVKMFKSFISVINFSEGLLCFKCQKNRVEVLDVNEGPRIVILSEVDGPENAALLPSWTPGKHFYIYKDKVAIAVSTGIIRFIDMDSNAILESSIQRYMAWKFLVQIKFSPNENVLAYPKVNGDMEFLRLCIPENPLLADIKHEATVRLEEKRQVDEKLRLEKERQSESEKCNVM